MLVSTFGVASLVRADVRMEARTHFRRGMALIAEGRVDEGVAALQEAYEILPHPNVLYNIARAYAESARYDEAIEYFRRYLASEPPDRQEVRQYLAAVEARRAAVAERERSRDRPPATPEVPRPTAVASTEELQALEDAAAQIATLAEATQSDALRRRADQLRALATQLREGRRRPSRPTSPPAIERERTAPVLAFRAGESDVYEESVVSAARFAQRPLEAPASTTVITRQDIRLSGLLYVPELLRRAAGVSVMTVTPSDSSIGIRGFNQRLSNRVVVLVDGRSTYLDSLGTTLWMTLPFSVSDIERIEILRGPASALYGANAFSGIVNIVTRPPGEPATEAMLGGGNGGTLFGHASTSGHIEHLAYRLAAGYLRAERFSREVAPGRVDYVASDDYGSPSLATEGAFANASLRYRVIPEIELSLEGGIVDRLLNFQGTGPLRDFVARGPVGHVLGRIETPYGAIRAFYNHVDAQAQLGASPVGGDPLIGDFAAGTLDVEAEFAQELEILVRHNLHVGASYRRKTIAWDYLGAEYEQNHYALFIQDSMRVTSWLDLAASFRSDFHPLLADPVFSPRGAVLVHPTETSTIRASVGTAFRSPTFLESYLDLDNPTPVPAISVLATGSLDLRPENILSAELGYRNEDFDVFDFEVNVYYNRVSNLISLAQVRPFRLADSAGEDAQSGIAPAFSPGTATYSIGTITFQNEAPVFDVIGGEAMARIHPITGLDLYANYSFNQTFTTIPQGTTGVFRDEEARTSTHHVNAGIQYRSDFGLDVSADVHFASEQRWLEQVFTADDGGGVRYAELDLPAYYLINARIGYRLWDDQLDLGLVGFNITDHRHRQHPFGQELSARFMFTVAYRM